MQFTLRENGSRDPDRLVLESLEPVIRGLGMSLIELSVFRGMSHADKAPDREAHGKERGGKPGKVRVIAVVHKSGLVGVEDCSRVHRAIMPRLELAFPGSDIYLEVSSPGINRSIKDGSEFAHYIGQEVKCYRTDISDWTEGVLIKTDEKGIVLRLESGETALSYEIIAKARLNSAPPHSGGPDLK